MRLKLAGPVVSPVDDTPIASAARVTPRRGPSRGRCPGTRAGDWPGHRHLRDTDLPTRDAQHVCLAPVFHRQRRYHGWSVTLRRPCARVSATPPTMWFVVLPLVEHPLQVRCSPG